MSTCKIEFHNIIFIFIILHFIIYSDHIVLVFKLYQTILNYNITNELSMLVFHYLIGCGAFPANQLCINELISPQR